MEGISLKRTPAPVSKSLLERGKLNKSRGKTGVLQHSQTRIVFLGDQTSVHRSTVTIKTHRKGEQIVKIKV